MPLPKIPDKDLKILLAYLTGKKNAVWVAQQVNKNYPTVYDWIGSRTVRAIKSGLIKINVE